MTPLAAIVGGVDGEPYRQKPTSSMASIVGVLSLQGTFLMNQAAAREMISSGVADGAIVNISSFFGKTGAPGTAGYYAAAKAGVMGLTKSVALELAPNGIRCNAILPGITDTPMAALESEDLKSTFVAATPMGRMGRPEEIAEAIKFLCTPGSSFMTGAMVEVTGGYAM